MKTASKSDRNICLKIIEEELDILSLSLLGFSKRRYNFYPTIYFSIDDKNSNTMFSDVKDGGFWTNMSRRALIPIDIDDRWHNFHNEFFFIKLIKILQGKHILSDGWFKDIRNASILVGQSFRSCDIAQCFLKNIIALETLLTDSNDKVSKELPKRVEFFIGWIKDRNKQGYQTFMDNLQNVYDKRCKYVHSGKFDEITVKDLIYTDELIFNIFNNIINNIKFFHSKEDLINHSRKVEAEQILGIKTKIVLKKFHFTSTRYTEKDYEQI